MAIKMPPFPAIVFGFCRAHALSNAGEIIISTSPQTSCLLVFTSPKHKWCMLMDAENIQFRTKLVQEGPELDRLERVAHSLHIVCHHV
jgi:hypothetical protein